jgi:serine/threonine protein kinase
MLVQTGRSIYLSAMGELEPGSVFAGHRIEEVAGRGGMGVVYRATQLALDRTVALKVIAPGLLEDQTVRSRFVRESKVAASIDHPNVIPIYYAGEEGGIAYIAMR